MKSRLSRILVLFFLHLCCHQLSSASAISQASGPARHHPPEHQSAAIPNHAAAIEREHKLMLECQDVDYRTYIKCLKREKRQHSDGFGSGKSCLDECFEQNCSTSECIRDCHTHCKKRLITTYSKTVETSYDCNNGECSPHSSASALPNITTNIHVTNVLPNGSYPTGPDDGNKSNSKPKTSADTIVPKVDIHNIINNQLGSSGNYPGWDCGCPGCSCYPYGQSIPQITIGIGGGPVGGCMFSQAWPCYQRFPTASVDCSICGNPLFRYRCDPMCYSDPRINNTQITMQTPRTTAQRVDASRRLP